MIRFFVALTAAAVPASAQVSPVTFESGKSLPLASGQWTYAATATGGEARFGTHLAIVCDKRMRTIAISRPGVTLVALTIITDLQSRTLPPNGLLSAHDPLLDAMALSRGRVLISGGGAAVLAVPNWPEATRAIEDCRN